MNILNELLTLSEFNSEKNLIGLKINGKKITDKTPTEKWEGNFNCSGLKLTSIKGSPTEVGIDFFCARNNITSLEGAPSKVGKDFNCYDNKLMSLKGAPSKVGGFFYCDHNILTSLEHAPSDVGLDFSCGNNKLTSLKDIHKILKKMNGIFLAEGNPITSNVLGLLLIPGCTGVQLDNRQVEDILNNHLPNTRGNRGLLDCQSELLDANLEDYAEL